MHPNYPLTGRHRSRSRRKSAQRRWPLRCWLGWACLSPAGDNNCWQIFLTCCSCSLSQCCVIWPPFCWRTHWVGLCEMFNFSKVAWSAWAQGLFQFPVTIVTLIITWVKRNWTIWMSVLLLCLPSTQKHLIGPIFTDFIYKAFSSLNSFFTWCWARYIWVVHLKIWLSSTPYGFSSVDH